MMKIDLHMPESLEMITKDIRQNGGKAYLVGGAVIDTLLKKDMKDWDVEVYGLSLGALHNLLSKYGTFVDAGKSFGVTKLKVGGTQYDFSLPRRENRIGKGHSDFNVELVPNMSVKEAACRRDLTINSLAADLEDGTLYDFYGGVADLEAGRMKHTSEHFSEDPLRVLRIMQLLPRKGKFVDAGTLALCRSISCEYPTISKERVFEEWNKLLQKAQRPSVGLDFLVDSDWIRWFPEIDVLRRTEQNIDWHPEGNVFNHTKMVLDNATKLSRELPEDWRLAFMYGALLHDVGKAVTTSDELKSPGHDEAGAPISRQFLGRITTEKDLTKRVEDIVRYHMRPGQLIQGDARDSAWKRLHNRLRLDVAGYISKADCAGRTGYSLDDPHPPSEKALELFKKYGPEPIKPLVDGDDLIARGYKQGKILGDELRRLYEIQLENNAVNKEYLLAQIIPRN
jgi:tRNA nucleotidyltransferase (CCA-adding enzyme)